MTRSAERFMFWTGLAVFVSLYFIFYPPIYAFRDEASYLSMAWLLKKGKLFLDEAGVPFQSWIVSSGRKVFDYPLGMPLLLLPFTFFGWHAAFLAGLISHLAGAFYFKKILKILGIENPALALLYLFHPALIFYSRTLMSDVPAAAFFLAGVYHYYKSGRPGWKAGAFFAFSLLCRPSGLVFILPFAASAVFKKSARLPFLFPLILCCGLIGTYQAIFYGSPLTSGYSQKFSTILLFSASYFPTNLPHYLISLSISYPALLLAPAAASRFRRPEILASVISGIVFFSFYFFHDRFPGDLETAVLGIRFLLPALALLLLMYAEVLNRFMNKPLSWLLFATLSFSALFIHLKHQRALTEQFALKETIYGSTPENSVLIYDAAAAELMQEAWGKRYYIDWRNGERRLSDYLAGADFTRSYFLVKLGGAPDRPELSWSEPGELNELQKRFDLKRIAKRGELEIYQFYAR